ncbi:BTAD domain-containing putative transcriptional regulator [Streptomyces sp. NPDC057271]|uniref:BTAD domain-containing putative transcriptional regulator n=1 Tax=unclassified Streptomyces TaxID=2593676 RepID=UPI003629D04A
MGTPTDIAVLGSLTVGREARSLGSKQRRLLAALVVDANRTVSADRLTFALWGDGASMGTTATLHSHVFRLRRHLADAGVDATISTEGSGYRLSVDVTRVDALAFEELVSEAEHATEGDRKRQAELLRRALRLWRGRPYQDLDDDEAAVAEAVRLEELRLNASEDLAEALISLGRHGEALGDLEALVRQNPFRERMRAALMLARYRSGRQAEALSAFHSYRQLLNDELGVEPSAELQRLQQDILLQAPTLSAPVATGTENVPAAPAATPAPGEAPKAGASPATKASLPTERKLVTVLVAGFAAADARTKAPAARTHPGHDESDPEVFADRLEVMRAGVVETVHRFGGTVLEVSHSGVTALFGAPVAAEDHALRACRAAEALQARSGTLDGQVPLSVACGSGEVLLRGLQSDTAEGYEAIGPIIEAARHAQQRAEGGILLSPSTRRLSEGLITVDGPTNAAERDPWVRLVSVAATTAWEARARRGLSALVGRERQLDLLLGLAEGVERGNGGVAGVVGAPGVGKSRLVYEFSLRVPTSWLQVGVSANPVDSATPFHPLLVTLRRLLSIAEDTSPEDGAAIVRRSVEERDSATAHATALCSILGLPVGEADGQHWAELDPGIRRRRTISAITETILRHARKRPLLLLVEDAHWLDGETLAVLDSIVDRISAAGVLLVVTYRPEHDPGWSSRSHFTLVRVDPLDQRQSSDLVGQLLGSHSTVHALRAQLSAWTGGVPLFLEESVRALAETGALTGESGDYVLRDATAPLRLPPRVHGLLASRIDRLSAAQKRLLQAAAVVGTEGSVRLLARVLSKELDDIDEDLAGLHRAEFVFERQHGTERGFVFKHAIVHDAAYASLPRAQRRTMHARAMEALSDSHEGRAESRWERLAHHAMQAERWSESVDLHSRAGERALHRCAYREAAVLLERALEAQQHLPPDPVREIDLYIQLRPALHAMGEFDRMLAHLARAEQLATEAGDEQRLLLVTLHRGYLLLTRGHAVAAQDVVKNALRLAERLGNEALAGECRLALGHCLTFAGDPQGVERLIEMDMRERTAAPLSERLGMAGTRPLFALAFMSMCDSMLGAFGRAAERLGEADKVVEEVDRPIDTVVAALGHGILELHRGRPEMALPPLQQAHATCAETGMPLISRWVEPFLAEALADLGHVEESVQLSETLLQAGEGTKSPLWQSGAHLGLARTSLADAAAETAARHAAAAAALAAEWGYPLTRSAALRLHAEASYRLGDHATALRYANESLDTATAIGAVPSQARCHLLIARLLRKEGRSADAQRHRMAAQEIATALELVDVNRALAAD